MVCREHWGIAALSSNGGNGKRFEVSGNKTIKGTFVPLPEDMEQLCNDGADCPSHGFTDFGIVGTWYHEAVDSILRNYLMGGVTAKCLVASYSTKEVYADAAEYPVYWHRL